jgi:hypothetical protein
MYEIMEWVSAKVCTGVQHFTLHSDPDVICIGPISAVLYTVLLIYLS